MKIALYIPNNWMHELADELSKHVEVHVNKLPSGCDAVLGMSESMVGIIPKVENLYLYQWDCYAWRGNPAEWVAMMKVAKEVWTPSQETTDLTKARYGIDSKVIKFFVPKMPDRSGFFITQKDYVMQGARDSEDIRWDWLERACQETGIPLIKTTPATYSRQGYLEVLSRCKAVISTRREASTGGLCLFEGAYFGKPLLAADCNSTIEYFGDEITYFEKDNYDDFKSRLVEVYQKPHKEYQLATSYTVDRMAEAILQRIKK